MITIQKEITIQLALDIEAENELEAEWCADDSVNAALEAFEAGLTAYTPEVVSFNMSESIKNG